MATITTAITVITIVETTARTLLIPKWSTTHQIRI